MHAGETCSSLELIGSRCIVPRDTVKAASECMSHIYLPCEGKYLVCLLRAKLDKSGVNIAADTIGQGYMQRSLFDI